MAYKAIVTKIFTRELPGADNLVIGSCGQYQVIVGKDTVDGQLGIFFEQDGQLSKEFCLENDLIRRKDPDGKSLGGMFEPNRRVKAIKLRGARSEGFWTKLDSIAYTGVDVSTLVEGTQFDTLNGHDICGKYYTPSTHNRRSSNSHRQQTVNLMFKKHIETGMFKRESQLIPNDSIIYITEKLHGTSQRYGNVLTDVPITYSVVGGWLAWLLGWSKTHKVWQHIIGTRNVILNNNNNGDESFRYNCVSNITLHKGEILYGEVVGYSNATTPIMSTHSTAALKNKAISKMFGDRITYSYGQLPGTAKFYVYRITQVNEDGYVVELSWNQVKRRCKELGIETVPELAYIPMNTGYLNDSVLGLTDDGDLPWRSVLSNSTLREGVVIRYESEHGTGWLKNKSFTFGCLEGYLKESDSYVDTEEIS